MSSIKVGFIGLGSMGMPMAKSLADSTLPLTVYDLRKEPCDEMKALGAKVAGSCREVAVASDEVISMVRDAAENEEVIFGKSLRLAADARGNLSHTIGRRFSWRRHRLCPHETGTKEQGSQSH